MNAPLPTLGEIVRRFQLSAQKKLGQNYLLDSNINQKIARAISPAGKIVMEIGPGPGGLTRALLEADAKHIFAVEYDRRFYPAINEVCAFYPDRLTLIEKDALKIDYSDYHLQKIVGNLPFNIATPLLAHWLMSERLSIEQIIILVQKEVADRIVATSHSRFYGRLSLLCQWRSAAKIHFTVKASAFTPSPKVDAALVEITPAPLADDPSPHAMDIISRAAFQQRRKMLRTNLKPLAELLEKADIDPTKRAEEISVAKFRVLAKLYDASFLV